MPKINLLDKWQKILYITIAISVISCGAVGAAWKWIGKPVVNQQIDIKLEPVTQAITYLNFLTMETMDPVKVERANKRYIAYKRGETGLILK